MVSGGIETPTWKTGQSGLNNPEIPDSAGPPGRAAGGFF